jgi:hypothetical protein
MADINDEVNAIAEHLRRLNIEFDRYGNLTAQSADAIRRRTAAEQYRDSQLEKSGQAAAQSLQSLGKAVGSAAGAMYEGRQGATAFNQSIENMNTAVKQAAIALSVLAPGGPLGKIITAGLTALGLAAFDAKQKLDEMGREMLDNSYTSYKKLADAGAATSAGLQGVADSAAKTGSNMLKMDEYLNLIGSNSKTLALFGESVSAGRRDFDDLGQALEGERKKFFALGFTQDTMNESMMQYVQLQTISGQAQKKTVDQLALGAKNYLYEQDALSKLTGLTRKEQTAIREQALSEQRFRAKLDAMRASGDERQIKAAAELETANLMLASQSPELAQGFRDLQSGAITTAAAQKAVISTNGEIMKSSQDLQNGLINAGEATTRIGEAGGKFAKDMNMSAQLGTFEDFAAKYAELKRLELFAAKSIDEKNKIIQAEQDRQTGKTPGADPMLDRYATLVREQQTTMTTLQQAMAKGFEVPILGFVGMGPSLKRVEESVSKAAVEALADYIKAFDAMPPKPRGPLGESKGPVKLNEEQKTALDKSIQVLADAEVNLANATKQLNEKAAESKAANAQKFSSRTSPQEKAAAAKKVLDATAALEEADEQFKIAKEAQLKALNEFNLAKQGRAAQTEPPKEKEKAKDNVPPANETDEAKQARIKKDAEEKAKKDAEEKAKKDAEEKAKKSEAKETAKITMLPNGARVLDDVRELADKGVPIISNVRTQEEQDKLKHHQDEKGNWFTKDNLPVAENSKHLTGDAIDVDTSKMTKDLEKLLKDNMWERPLPKSDPGHWQRVPKSQEKKTSEVTPNDVNLAESLAKNLDLSDATAGLTINSDVATLNSKGMNVTLDNSSDVAKLIMEPMITQMESSQKDQSMARTNFENSIGDLKAEMSKQKATDELLLAAVQELIRIQKNGVSVNEKILAAQA